MKYKAERSFFKHLSNINCEEFKAYSQDHGFMTSTLCVLSNVRQPCQPTRYTGGLKTENSILYVLSFYFTIFTVSPIEAAQLDYYEPTVNACLEIDSRTAVWRLEHSHV